MPDASGRMKRPPTFGFGEGTVVKRTRNNAGETPKRLDSRPPTAKAILSGPDKGFCVKPNSAAAGLQKPARPQGIPLNEREAVALFKPTDATTAQITARLKPPFAVRPPPLQLSDDNPFVESQKEIRRVARVGSTATLATGHLYPPDLRSMTRKPTTPSRKVLPFHLLRVPVSIPDTDPTQSSATPLKKPRIPKFDLGVKGKGKLKAMTAMELPTAELPEEKEIEGEALELQRGLLVSPEKGDRRRGRFIRNGLAERAQMLMNRSSTALILWRKERESSVLRAGRFHSDLRLRVKRVAQVSRNENTHSRSAGTLRSILADVHDSHALGSSQSIKEDAEILVWKPWQETKHPPTLFCSRFFVLPTSP